MSEKPTTRLSAEEIARLRERRAGRTDWQKLRTLSDAEIESAAAADEDTFIPPADWWETAKLVVPPAPKKLLSIRIDQDVLDFFKSQGAGYQSRINAVLRSYVDAMRKRA